MKLPELIEAAAGLGIKLDDRMISQLDLYAAYLKEYNEKINLTAITEYEEVLDKHFYDSLLCLDRPLEGVLADVGSGAGFPGVVLKIVFPQLKVVLIEPIGKRCVFLESLIAKLGLEGIEVVNARGEDHSLDHREAYDYVTARAVTNLPNLIEICGAMVRKEGCFICLRGRDGIKELEEAGRAIATMGFEVETVLERQLAAGDERLIAYLRKVRQTPVKYPRKYSIIKKNPL